MDGKHKAHIIKTLLPLGFDLSAQTLMWNLEAFILGHYSTDALAGVGIASQLLIFLFIAFLTMIMGATILISRHLGANELAEANKIFSQSVNLSLFSALIIGILGFLSASLIFKQIIGLDNIIACHAVEYFKTLSLFIPFIVVNFTIIGIIRGAGDTFVSMILNVSTHVLNAILAFGFILGKFNLPHLGAAGAAYAIGYAQIFGLILSIILLKSKRTRLSLSSPNFQLFDWKTIKRLLKVGLPITFENMGFNLAHLVLSIYLSHVSGLMLAAHQILLRLQQLISMIFQGVGIGNMNLYSIALSEKDKAKEEASLKISYIYSVIIAITAGVIFFIFSEDIIRFFNNNPTVVLHGSRAIKILAFLLISKALCVITMSALRARADLRRLIVVTWVNMLVIDAGLGWVATFILNLGVPGIWAVLGIDESIKVLVHSRRLRQDKIKAI